MPALAQSLPQTLQWTYQLPLETMAPTVVRATPSKSKATQAVIQASVEQQRTLTYLENRFFARHYAQSPPALRLVQCEAYVNGTPLNWPLTQQAFNQRLERLGQTIPVYVRSIQVTPTSAAALPVIPLTDDGLLPQLPSPPASP